MENKVLSISTSTMLEAEIALYEQREYSCRSVMKAEYLFDHIIIFLYFDRFSSQFKG